MSAPDREPSSYLPTAVAALLTRDEPPMRIDLGAAERAGARRVHRRRLAWGGIGTAATAGVAALALMLGPLRGAPPAPAGPTEPPITATATRGVTWLWPELTDEIVVDRAGRRCGPVPASLVEAFTHGDGRMIGDLLTPVGDAEGDLAVVAGTGEVRPLRLVNLATGAVVADVDEVRGQQVAVGSFDGRYAVYAKEVMGGLSEDGQVLLWDAQTRTRTVIGALDATGWGPHGGPIVLGDGYAVWAEVRRDATGTARPAPSDATRKPVPSVGTERLVAYELATGRLWVVDVAAYVPVVVAQQMIWAVAPTGAMPARELSRLRLLSVEGTMPPGRLTPEDPDLSPEAVASDGRSLAYVTGNRLYAVDLTSRGRPPEPRLVRALPGAGPWQVAVHDGLALVSMITRDDQRSLLVDLSSGGAVALPYGPRFAHRTLVGPGGSRTSTEKWRAVLGTCPG